MAELPAGTVTLLFTDIEGSTRLLQQLGEEYRAAIEDHHRLLRQAIEVDGHVVEDRGDGFFAAFARAADALGAAVVAQRALAAHDWPGGAAVRVRMGLHTGDPALVGANYVGLDVHRAARISDAGHGGQILLSAATRELVAHQLPEGVSLRDLGEHRLRDIQRAEHVSQAVIVGLPDSFPPLRTVGRTPNNLPTARTSIIGRDADVATIRALLLREDPSAGSAQARLVTLTGPGGSGKTRLGLQVATTVLDQFEDGVFLVMLAPVSDPALVPAAIASALGLRVTADRSLLEVVKEYLHERHVLLLLDNFEQLLPAAPLVAELLDGCPRVKVLVTSRALLRLRGEREVAVQPLALPAADTALAPERLQQYAAVALFAERARESRPDFAVTTENAPAVAEICQRLDGLPLAIELAAARARLLSPQAMLGRLGRRLPFLTGGSRDLPARQQTLRDTIGWSYDLLTPEEQRLCRRLGVFVGGCTIDAAEAVCEATFDEIASLVEKSLLRQVDGPDGEPRFTMLETIREYALEHLEASGEADEIRLRHAECFERFANVAEPELIHASDSDWFDRVDADHNNIRAALAWSSITPAAVGLFARIANPLWAFWWLRGHWAESRAWYDRALDLPLAPDDRLGALRGRAQIAIQAGDYALSATLWDEAIDLARRVGDLVMLSTALGRQAHTAGQSGDPKRGIRLAEESLAVAEQSGHPERIALAWNEIGNTARARGDIDRGREAYEEALRRARAARLGFYVPYALQALTNDALDRRELDRATVLVGEAFDLFKRRDDRWGTIGCMGHLVRIARLRGERDRVVTLACETIALARAIGSTPPIADSIRHLSWAARIAGQPKRAIILIGAATAINEAIGRRFYVATQRDVDAELDILRTELGEAAFAAAWENGRAMSVDRAVRYALEEIDIQPGG